MTEGYCGVLGALAGLEGATTGHEKSEDTDRVICEALAELGSEKTEEEITLLIGKIHEEKFRIAPDCASCASPCGRTADQDIALCQKAADSDAAAAMESLAELLPQAASVWLGYSEKVLTEAQRDELMEQIYTAIAYLGYGLEAVSYVRVRDKISRML